MKKTIFILFVLLSYFLPAPAKEHPIAFKTVPGRMQHSVFNKVALIDLRQEKQYLGSLKGGIKKHPLIAAFPLDSMMAGFGAALIQQARVKDNYTLAMALQDLIIEEKYNGEFQVGNIYLNARFYLEHEGHYTEVYHIDSLFEFQVSDYPAEELAKVSGSIFSGLFSSIAAVTVPEGAPAFGLQEVQDRHRISRSQYPVYSQEQQPGVYYTFEQFIGNTPGDTAFIHKHAVASETTFDYFYKKKESGKKGTDLSDTVCYAIYSNGKWYRPYGKKKDFREMNFRNGDFFYMEKGEGLIQRSAASYGFFGGGILGYLVADAAAQNANANHPNRQGKAVFRYKLNPETGAGIKVERLE